MNKPQTYAEQLARKDIEALDDNDKKLKKLLGEYHDEEITNLKNMTKQTPTKLEELIEDTLPLYELPEGMVQVFGVDRKGNKYVGMAVDKKAFIKKVYEAGGEAERNRAIKALTVDMTEMRFTDDKWKKRWEVFEDRGVDPCIECSNSDNIKDYLKNQHETK